MIIMNKKYYLRKSLTFLGYILILMHSAAMATEDCTSVICCFSLSSGPTYCYFNDKAFVVNPSPIPDPGPYLPGIGLDSIMLGQPIILVSHGLREDWLKLSEGLFDPHSSWVFKDDYIMPGICESDLPSSAANYMRFVPNSFYCGYFPQEDSTVIAIQAKTQSRPTEPLTDLRVFSYHRRGE